MFKCACGAEFFDEAIREEITCYVNGYAYRENFVCCPECGGDDYWDVQAGGSEEEDAEEDD